MQRSAEDHQRLNVLGKALAVLEAVADQPYGIGLPDLAVRLNLPRQTVHRVLRQLQDSGLLLRDPVRERFSVGPRMTRLALGALYQAMLAGTAAQWLADPDSPPPAADMVAALRALGTSLAT